MATKKTQVARDMLPVVYDELNKGMNAAYIAKKYTYTIKAVNQFIVENYRRDGWDWKYK